jgi:hypothetical protein
MMKAPRWGSRPARGTGGRAALPRRLRRPGHLGPGRAQRGRPQLPLRQVLGGSRVRPARVWMHQLLPHHPWRNLLALPRFHIAALACRASRRLAPPVPLVSR